MIKKFDALYARDSKGKILSWKVQIENNGGSIDIFKSYGEYEGKKALRWERDIKGVNEGKTNETNAWEQAIFKCKSYIALKKKKGYLSYNEICVMPVVYVSKFKIIKNIENEDNILKTLKERLPLERQDIEGDIKPMKCQQYYRSKKEWTDPEGKTWSDRKYYYLLNPDKEKERGAVIQTFPCMGQPKINGVRATITLKNNKATIKSKEGLIYDVSHIEDFLNINNDIFNYDGLELILDGELYIHGELLQDIVSAVKKVNLNTPRITFVLFDLAIANKSNTERWNIIKEHIKPKLEQHLNCPVTLIRTTGIKSDKQAQTFTDICIKDGYEGAIFRTFEGEYGFGKRPKYITKLKRTISEEFKIFNVLPQEKDNSKGNFVCLTKKGLPFEVNPKGDDDFKRFILENKNDIIGKNLTIDFYEYTKDNKPFHILNNLIRNYE